MKKKLPTADAAAYKFWVREIFEYFILRMMRRDFSDVCIWGEVHHLPEDLPVIFVANHTSWWDGFFLWRLQRYLARKRPIYSVMLAREYQKIIWFRWVGALPIEPGRLASIRSLLRRLKILAHSERKTKPIISFFPQGAIKPSYARPFVFESGLKGILHALKPVAVFPIGIHIEPLCERRPRVFLMMAPPIIQGNDSIDIKSIQEELTNVMDTFQHTLADRGEAILIDIPKSEGSYVSLI